MRANLKSSFNYTIAVLLIILGIIGWVLPVLPGIVLMAAGLVILSIENPKLDSYIESKFASYPKAEKAFLSIKSKFEKIFGYSK